MQNEQFLTMMINATRPIVISLVISFFIFASGLQAQQKRLERKATRNLQGWTNPVNGVAHMGNIALDSLAVMPADRLINLYYNKNLTYWPWRPAIEKKFKESLKSEFRGRLKSYQLQVYSNGSEVNNLIPNRYRAKDRVHQQRLSASADRKKLLRRQGQLNYTKGLSDNYIALWHSHGWYYESKLDRWEWQRARLYGSVEDVSPMMYVLPYLVPMLENAGATTFLPRERSFQQQEVIVDNDVSTQGSRFELEPGLSTSSVVGFAARDTLFPGDNPFKLGSALNVSGANGKVAHYLPYIPAKGMYEVYVSYQQSSSNTKQAEYKINHTGGSTSFFVNQSMGGGTWIYLGSFDFNKGLHPDSGSVELSCKEGTVSIDAIRFGGGMGNVARRPGIEVAPNQWSLKSGQTNKPKGEKVNPDNFRWKTSQRPRYMEAARYWLQYAGMPDTLIFNLNDDKNDYNDDYQSRGEWVGYLMGKPNGPTGYRNVPGLNIPIDLAFAFHTDAGVTPDDSIIGTLGIFSTAREDGIFPNGQSKLASRDLCDVVQTQIVEDIRALFNPDWTRRAMWDKQYSEAWRPNVPTMLLELYSHQNLADMQYGLDPRFRFHVSRAIYKGMLRFLAFQEGREFVVQPLPVDHMAILKQNDGYKLSWQPVKDPLEKSALPTQYKVYKRIGNNGFDNGTLVSGTSYKINNPVVGQHLSFKVTAVNQGGESMPGEILSMGIAAENAPTVLVVNAFDRVSAPAFVDKKGFAGVAWWNDQGVADQYEYGHTGNQYDFDRKSPWLDDDSPGWGGSYADMEGKAIPGNSFDNVITHGQSILQAGYSYVSVSDEVFESEGYEAKNFKAVDIILGEEKATPGFMDKNQYDFKIYTQGLMDRLKELAENATPVFISGAYIGSEMQLLKDTIVQQFAAELLHFKWRSNHAVNRGEVEPTDKVSPYFKSNFTFNTQYHPHIYAAEAPDAIEPADKNALTAFRYSQNGTSAGVIYNGNNKTVVLGFPFETILRQEDRDKLMKEILEFFKYGATRHAAALREDN
ncbi:hypothetical protein SAMN06265379_101697 [Saccharicrinis carchari]|uniref:Fibronectin type-III domain-containing protein n=1 Tax=Saccharicrinis carchari TaxID=1168039 RepID=A0A521B498_SACCC|nr:hypothetical protein [Saccharicrinis carchari]SMO41927.1 hypothetical protein SAMN06265379_101697 [Saccharicrinis carchari]